MRKLFWISLLFCLVCLPTLADTLLVGSDDGYPSISKAIASARDGDVIVLTDSMYSEPGEAFPIVIDKSVIIRAEEGVNPVINTPTFKAAFEVTAQNVTIKGLIINLRRWGILGTADGLKLENNVFRLIDEKWRVSSSGVWLAGVSQAIIINNSFEGVGLCLAGPRLSERSRSMPVLTGLFEVGDQLVFFNSHNITGNNVNGKPLYYFVNQDTMTVPEDAGQLIAVDCDNLIVANLDVSDTSIGLTLAYCRNPCILNVRADRCGIFGVYLAYVEEGSLENVSSMNANHGIDLRAVKNVTIQSCSTTDCEQGIFLSWVDLCVVDGCVVSGGGNGYFLSDGNHNLISRSAANNCENGFSVQKEKYFRLCECRASGNTVTAVRLNQVNAVCTQNTFSENWVGMLAYGGEPMTLFGNRFTDCGSCGLYLRDAKNSVVCGNIFVRSGADSMQLEGKFIDTQICLNSFDVAPVDHSQKE